MVGVISDEMTEVGANVGSESSSSIYIYKIEIHNQLYIQDKILE